MRVVRSLIQYGADECKTMTQDQQSRTAFELLVDTCPTAAKLILDENVYTNGQGGNSIGYLTA